MTLQQVAKKAMDYLDSVGVAADYGIYYMHLRIYTDEHILTCAYDDSFELFILDIKHTYPPKPDRIKRIEEFIEQNFIDTSIDLLSVNTENWNGLQTKSPAK